MVSRFAGRHAFLLVVFIMLCGCCLSAPLPLDCSVVQAPYTTSSILLNNTLDTITVAAFEGTAFFVDCFNFAVTNTIGCVDGHGGAVQSWALTVDSATHKELSRHPLAADLLGPSILSSAYYYGQSRIIYLQLRAASMPSGCTSMNVTYSFSGYTSTQPPLAVGVSTPYVVSASDSVIVKNIATTINLRIPGKIAQPQTFSLGFVDAIFVGNCSYAKSSGSIAYTYLADPVTGKRAPFLQWTSTFARSSFNMLCIRRSDADTFQYIGVVNIWRSNPAFFKVADLPLGTALQMNQPYTLTFVGINLAPGQNADQAKLGSLIALTCSFASPAGGVPLGTNLLPQGVATSNRTYWGMTITIPGAFFVCYSHQGSWSSVPWFQQLAVNSRDLVNDVQDEIDDGGIPAYAWLSRSRSLTIVPPLPPSTIAPSSTQSDLPSSTSEPTTTTTTTMMTTTTSTSAASTTNSNAPTSTFIVTAPAAPTTTTSTDVPPTGLVSSTTTTTAAVVPSSAAPISTTASPQSSPTTTSESPSSGSTSTSTVSVTTTSRAPLPTTTSTAVVRPTTTTTTVAPRTTTAAPNSACLQLPEECSVLENVGNQLRLILSVQYRVATFTGANSAWRLALSEALCIALSSIAIFEMQDSPSTSNTASLVVGIAMPSNTAPAMAGAADTLSALFCLGSTMAISTDPVANQTYQRERNILRADPLLILDAMVGTSAITTANTTNHAAPSENDTHVSVTTVAVISSGVVIGVGCGVGALLAIVAYRKRKLIRQQLGRLMPGEVFRADITARTASRNADLVDVEALASGQYSSQGGNGSFDGGDELSYPLMAAGNPHEAVNSGWENPLSSYDERHRLDEM